MNPSAASIPQNVLQEHGSFVRSLAYSLLRDEHLAEDVAQETWVRWMQNPPEEQGRTRGWLATVVRGVALTGASSRRARRERELAMSVPEATGDPAKELEQAELIKVLVEGVIELEEPLQSAILLTYFRGWSTRRIAQEQSISASTVSQRVRRGLHELRTKLDSQFAVDRDGWHNALVAVAGKGALGSSVPMGIAATLPLLPWLLAVALVLVVAVSNWQTSEEPAPIDLNTLNSVAADAPPSQIAKFPSRVKLQQPQASERQAILTTTPEGKLRIAGQVTNQAYPELDMQAGPAGKADLSVRVWSGGGVARPSVFQTEKLDEMGRFDLLVDDSDIRPLSLMLGTKGSESYHPCTLQLKLEEGQNEALDIELTRMPTGHLSGIVVDEAGRALPKIDLTLRGGLGRERFERKLTTDESGSFRVPHRFPTQAVSVETPGYAYISHTGGSFIHQEDGGLQAGWSDLRVTVTTASILHVRVVDPGGAGISGVRVTASMHESEVASLGLGLGMFDVAPTRSAETDSKGDALLDLWADRRIEIRVSVARESHTAYLTQGETLLFEPFASGQAIVLAKGEVRDLTVRWNARYALRGQVLGPDGELAADATIKVYDAGAKEPYSDSLGSFKTDDQGEFNWELLRKDVVGPLVLVARHQLEVEPSGMMAKLSALGYAGDSESPEPPKPTEESSARAPSTGALELSLESAVDGVLTGTLRLAPAFSIAGRVRSVGGDSPRDGFGGSLIWVVPAGSGSRMTKTAMGTGIQSTPDGQFRFMGLPAGHYDIYVSREMKGFYSFSSFLHCFEKIAAGEENLDLVIPEQGIVQIKLRVHGVQTDKMTVLHGRYSPFDPGSYDKPVAPELQAVRSLSDWPLGAPVRFAGISGDQAEDAKGAMGMYGTTGIQDHDLPPMGAGWYTIGVNLRGAGDEPSYSPMATPIQYFEPGEYIIDFYPVETVAVEGLLTGPGQLGVWIVDGEGGTLPWHSGRGAGKLKAFAETSASGEFKLPAVPVGEWRVRLGKSSDLARGSFQREVLVKFYAGMPDLVLAL